MSMPTFKQRRTRKRRAVSGPPPTWLAPILVWYENTMAGLSKHYTVVHNHVRRARNWEKRL